MQYVRIYYGPCDTFFTLSHKPQKLRGLREYLQTLGFRVDLIPVDFVNYCMIEMCGHEVFRCNIKNLCFNTPSEQDPVCRRAINAVVESSGKFLRARTYMWLWAYIDDSVFRSEFAPKEYWPFALDDNLNVK
ncbi:unnamed protein product [Colias eurytheme]|nr:unnamed protein product [Colias eurytheme]